jgi:hypothetical protein
VKRRGKMSHGKNVRLGLLRFLYLYTVLGAGGFGVIMILSPGLVVSLFNMPEQDPYIYGIAGSIWATFGILSLFGLRSPLKFLPVLLMQFCYKSIWLVGVVLPVMIGGYRPLYGYLFTAIMVSYVVLDLIAIPFGYILGEKSDAPVPSAVQAPAH